MRSWENQNWAEPIVRRTTPREMEEVVLATVEAGRARKFVEVERTFIKDEDEADEESQRAPHDNVVKNGPVDHLNGRLPSHDEQQGCEACKSEH